jgi:ribonuclease P protein component
MQQLKTREQFQAVMTGRALARTQHFALHVCELGVLMSVSKGGLQSDVSATCLGALVPKRWAKKAVTRNTIKRQIYAVAAALGVVLARRAYVVRLSSGFDRAEFKSAKSAVLNQAVRSELHSLFKFERENSAKTPGVVGLDRDGE